MEQNRGKGEIRKLVALWQFLKPYQLRFFFALIAMVIAAGSVLVLGTALKHVIDEGYVLGDMAALNRTLSIVAIVALVQGVATFIRYYLFTWVCERFVADIRKTVFGHILNLSPTFFEKTRTGEVISRLTNDTQRIETVVIGVFSFALRNFVMMIGGIVMLAITSLKLTLIILAAVPLVVTPILLLGRRVRKTSEEMQNRVADSSSYIDETIHEIRVVQAYTHEAVDRDRFADQIERVFKAGVEAGRYRAAMIASVIVLAFSSIAFVLWIGGRAVITGEISPGDLSAFLFYAILVANGVMAISETWSELQRAAGASERLMDLLSTSPEIKAPQHPKVLPAQTPLTGEQDNQSYKAPIGRVRFDQVTFYYPSRTETAALQNFSLEIQPGEIVAFTGPSGAGKTTVFQLLLRFYDPQQGRLLVEGVDIRELEPTGLRQHFSIVTQEPIVFADSVLENVRYGRPDATREAVIDACQAAYCMQFIEKLPHGLDTQLGERGTKLSGGQRQRIALARAFLADRPILLLDEATSSLDAESEQMVQQAMDKLIHTRTTLVIAHRFSTIQSADRIIVMDHGTIQAMGTHRELIEQGGLYARQAALQLVTEQKF
ncbi:MAG TPA: ABC transporter transmembrane domain-containing protein [Nitrosomonas sp.]|nr:ABC transporter transmembrane domain-containing protein [Nitrosomonas sp.]